MLIVFAVMACTILEDSYYLLKRTGSMLMQLHRVITYRMSRRRGQEAKNNVFDSMRVILLCG